MAKMSLLCNATSINTLDGELLSVVRVSADEKPMDSKRAPVVMIAVVDRSGSMASMLANSAQNKMERVHEALRVVNRAMQADDLIAVISFDTEIEVTMGLSARLSDIELEGVLTSLQPRGGTNIAGGIEKGFKLIKDADIPDDANIRMVVLTDGQANAGISKAESVRDFVTNLRLKNSAVTISSFGVGVDYNTVYMNAVSEAGGGGNYHIESDDDVPTFFQREFDMMANVTDRDVRVEVAPRNSSIASIKCLNAEPDKSNSELLSIKLGDLVEGEIRDLIFKVDFQPNPTKLGDAQDDIEEIEFLTQTALPHMVDIFTAVMHFELAVDPGKKEVTDIQLLSIPHGSELIEDKDVTALCHQLWLASVITTAADSAANDQQQKLSDLTNRLREHYDSLDEAGKEIYPPLFVLLLDTAEELIKTYQIYGSKAANQWGGTTVNSKQFLVNAVARSANYSSGSSNFSSWAGSSLGSTAYNFADTAYEKGIWTDVSAENAFAGIDENGTNMKNALTLARNLRQGAGSLKFRASAAQTNSKNSKLI